MCAIIYTHMQGYTYVEVKGQPLVYVAQALFTIFFDTVSPTIMRLAKLGYAG